MTCDRARIYGFRALGGFVCGEDVGYREETRIGRPKRGGVAFAEVGFKRARRAFSVFAQAACAVLPLWVEDDPVSGVFTEPESWRFGFAARHGVPFFRMAEGVVKSLPATRTVASPP